MRSIIRALCCLGLAFGAGAVVRQALAKTRGAPADPRANQPTLPPGDPGVPAGEQLLQKVVRCRTASGQEVVRGTLVAEFEAGQKDAVAFIAFCPPFERLPRLDVAIDNEIEGNVKVAQLLHQGAQLIVELPEPLDEAYAVTVSFSAVGG